ncbi:hypothetical protein HK098_003685 [Nowakowskiella sp. JEL0407]|nr:hypothetical protein HK098_003685 [Nowakowskiella sp. JEL0407]
MSHTLYNNELPPPNNFGDKPHPTKINNATVYSLSTKFIRVDCELSDDKDLVLKWYDISGPPRLFQEDLPYRAYAYERHSGVYHYTKSLPNQVHVGLGEHTGVLQLNERKFRLESMDALGYNAESTDPLYKVTPFYITIDTDSNDTFAYGTFYDNLSTGYIDFSKEIDAFWGPYRVYKAESGILDYYVITGVNVEKFSPIETIIERYAHLVGKPALIPRFGLGYLASSMGYADSENAQELLEEFPKKCRENDIPCDLMHLSSGYTGT